MAKEIERKYRVISLPDNLGEPKLIKQGYIFIEEEKHLRIRLMEDHGVICLKYTNSAVDRDEFEYLTSLADAQLMYGRCKYKLEKKRYKIPYGEFILDLDVYPVNPIVGAMKVVEIELPSIDYSFEKPYWFGDEITGVSKYSNIELSKHNLKF